MSELNLANATGFVLEVATEEDIARLLDAVKQRRSVLRAKVAAAVSVGKAIKLDGLAPRYLNELSGVVESISGSRASVELDEESTGILRWTKQSRFPVADGVKRYVLRGIPLSCCKSVN